MRISGETNNLDLYSDARFLCGILLTDTTTYPLADFVRNANFGLDKVNALAMKADGKWKFIDNNSATGMIDTSVALESGTPTYAIPITWLKMGRVRAKDAQGNFNTLTPVDRRQLSDSKLNDSTGGNPKYYVQEGTVVRLLPTPNYDSTGGLEVQQQMGSTYFAYNATTTVPGFDSRFHRLISLYSAEDYCEANELDRKVQKIQTKLLVMEQEFMIAIRTRDNDQKISLIPKREDYGENSLSSNSNFGGGQNGF